jgi:hypothetical protein
VSGGGHLSVGDRVVVAGDAGHRASEVSHVDHQGGVDVGGDLGQAGEVDPPGIGGIAGHQDQGANLSGVAEDGVVVEPTGAGVDAITVLFEHLAEDVRPEPVSEMPAGVKGHAQHALVAQPAAQVRSRPLVQVVGVAHSGLIEKGTFHPPDQDPCRVLCLWSSVF